MARTKRAIPNESPQSKTPLTKARFGWCLENTGNGQHTKCQVSFVAGYDSANWHKGDTVYCQCPCHDKKVAK
jgi:hypothetical protein